MGSNGNNRKLLSPEREDLILAALGDGVRTIAELAGALQVSEATVRRDLHSLENRGAVQRGRLLFRSRAEQGSERSDRPHQRELGRHGHRAVDQL